jgi:hypothetical protein
MVYRAYTSADLPACLAIIDSNAERYYSRGDREDFERFLDAPPGFFCVLCADAGSVVACGGIGLRDDGRTAVLTWGMVLDSPPYLTPAVAAACGSIACSAVARDSRP